MENLGDMEFVDTYAYYEESPEDDFNCDLEGCDGGSDVEALYEVLDEQQESYFTDGLPFLNKYFLRCGEGGWATLFAINAETKGTETHWYNVGEPGDLEKMQSHGYDCTSKQCDVYFSGCLSDQKTTGRIRQTDVALVPALFMDIDTLMDNTKAGKDLPRDPDEVFEKLSLLPFSPSLMVASGHGVHAYWVFTKPIRIEDEAHLEDVKRFMREFAEMIADTLGYSDLDVHASEPARVLRLPKTTNWKCKPYESVDEYPNVEARYYNEQALRKICSDAATRRRSVHKKDMGRHDPSMRAVYTDDDEIVGHIEGSPELSALWSGDITKYGNDHSRGDFAMCAALAKYTKCDPNRIDTLFRKSSLFRDKWDEKRGDSTYGRVTIEKAIRSVRVDEMDLSDPSELGTAKRFASTAPSQEIEIFKR